MSACLKEVSKTQVLEEAAPLLRLHCLSVQVGLTYKAPIVEVANLALEIHIAKRARQKDVPYSRSR